MVIRTKNFINLSKIDSSQPFLKNFWQLLSFLMPKVPHASAGSVNDVILGYVMAFENEVK